MPLFKEHLKPHLDRYYYPGNWIHDSGEIEMGDSSQRLGMILTYERFTGNKLLPAKEYSVYVYELLDTSYGPRRHWDARGWPGKSGTLSRDNAQSMIVGNALYAKTIFPMLAKRLGFFWNTRDISGKVKKLPITDFAGPVVWSSIFRSANWWWMYPFIAATDSLLFLKAIFRVLYSKWNPRHTTDELNTQCLLVQANHSLTTPFGWLASVIYFKYGPRWALWSYFRRRNHMTPPPLHLLFDDMIDWKNKETRRRAEKRGVRF